MDIRCAVEKASLGAAPVRPTTDLTETAKAYLKTIPGPIDADEYERTHEKTA